MTCGARGCRRNVHRDSYYGRCGVHMWCEHCRFREVKVGVHCPQCKDYRRRNGRLPPDRVLAAARRRLRLG